MNRAWLCPLLVAAGLAGCHRAGTVGPDPGTLYQSIGEAFLRGDLDGARARAERARHASSAGRDAYWEARFNLQEAQILLHQSRPADALDLMHQLPSPAGSRTDLAIRQAWLAGFAHFRLRKEEESDRELAEAHRLADSTRSSLLCEVLRTEALVARDRGQPELALAKFTASLAAARDSEALLKAHGATDRIPATTLPEIQAVQAADMVNIGYASLQRRQFGPALALLEEAADYARKVEARRELELAVGNMGWAYHNLGDFESALASFVEAEQVARQIGMTARQVLWLQDAGRTEYRLGDLPQALRYERQALAIALTRPLNTVRDQVVSIETNLALLLYEQGQETEARTYADRAVQGSLGSNDRNVVAYTRYVRGLLTAYKAGRESEELFMSALGPAKGADLDPDLRTEIQNALGNLCAERHQPAQAARWFQSAVSTFEQKRSEVKDEALRLPAFGYGDAVYRDYSQFLLGSHRPSQALQLLDRSRARTLEEGLGFEAEQQSPRSEDPRAVARRLDAIILFYSLGPARSALWAVTAREIRVFALPGRKAIQSWVEQYRQTIRTSSSDLLEAPSPAATELYNALVAPAAPLIPVSGRVIVVPDGVLYALSFETLPEPAPTTVGLRYWIEHVTLMTVSSIRMLSRPETGSRKPPTQDLLVIGDPVTKELDQALPAAAKEVQQIREHFPPGGQRVITRAAAVPAAYAGSDPGQFRYIHITAHGTASQLSPLDSAVALSAPPDGQGDFRLYARDIVHIPLNARLVTISTCYGSGRRTYAGEGIVGLAWVFLRAGAHNVIGALWDVNDAVTAKLMDRFYGELQAGQDIALALRSAKLALIHSGDVSREPYYWGAFQLYTGS
jgi:CHAT domain-containing protein/tetratricopeptide (TPR) repeat protein